MINDDGVKVKGFCITIWDVESIDENSNLVLGHKYFLSFRRARKWMEKHETDYLLNGIKMTIGGEDLWIW